MGGRWKHQEGIKELVGTEAFSLSHLPIAVQQAISKGDDEMYEDTGREEGEGCVGNTNRRGGLRKKLYFPHPPLIINLACLSLSLWLFLKLQATEYFKWAFCYVINIQTRNVNCAW